MTPATSILVVDDEPSILHLLAMVLSAEGYEVVTASNGEEAHHLARTRWFDLFLIDLIMPCKDGIETMLALRSFRKNVPIIAMSGGWHGGTRSCLPLAEKLGACRTLKKPFDLRTLIMTVQSIFDGLPPRQRNGFAGMSCGKQGRRAKPDGFEPRLGFRPGSWLLVDSAGPGFAAHRRLSTGL